MFKPLVSIIIPSYNAEKYLAGTIKSAIGQTWSNKEIIIVDDGSTDNSYAIAKRFEASDVFVIQQENRGASAARNRGLKASKGEYIQFLDADDLLSPNKIGGQVSQLIKNHEKLSLCATIQFTNELETDYSTLHHQWYSKGTDNPIDFITKLYKSNVVGTGYGGMIQPNAWLTPKKLIDKAGNWDETISVDDDGEFFCRVILVSKGIIYNCDEINYYRKHSSKNNLSSDKSKRAFSSRLKALNSKYKSFVTRSGNRTLANQVFASNYMQLGIQSYPQCVDISKFCINQAKSFGYRGAKYEGAKKSTALSKIIGWKITRWLMFYLYKI